MDIQKEREAYLKMLVGNDAISNDQADTLKLMSGGSHFYTYGNQVSVAKLDLINWGWNSWVNAKSQVVPEGFVLVPKCKSESFSQELDNYLDDLWKSGNAFDDGFVSVNEINHDKIWSLVIKAEEQNHDSQNP